MVSVRPSRRSQVARSACESSGRAPGLAGDLAEHDVDEPGLEPQPGEARRLGHRAAQLVLAHRAEQDLVGGDRLREPRMRAQLAVEVGAHPDRHRPRVREQRVDEALPRVGVVAERVQLLELVDDDERRGIAVDRRGRLRPGLQQPRTRKPGSSPASTDAIRPARSSEDFPLPDAPTSASRRPRREPFDDRAQALLAPEEELAVARVERQQPAVGALRRGTARRPRGRRPRGASAARRRP